MLTSRYTMDAVNPAARREIAGLADLVGAVRLPAGAHRRAAGTDAVTDLLILRRRDPDAPPAGAQWERTRHVDVDGVRWRSTSTSSPIPSRCWARSRSAAPTAPTS